MPKNRHLGFCNNSVKKKNHKFAHALISFHASKFFKHFFLLLFPFLFQILHFNHELNVFSPQTLWRNFPLFLSCRQMFTQFWLPLNQLGVDSSVLYGCLQVYKLGKVPYGWTNRSVCQADPTVVFNALSPSGFLFLTVLKVVVSTEKRASLCSGGFILDFLI